MAWVEKDHNAHPVPTPCYVQGRQPADQAAQSHVQPGLECFHGWGIHSLLGQPIPGPPVPPGVPSTSRLSDTRRKDRQCCWDSNGAFDAIHSQDLTLAIWCLSSQPITHSKSLTTHSGMPLFLRDSVNLEGAHHVAGLHAVHCHCCQDRPL